MNVWVAKSRGFLACSQNAKFAIKIQARIPIENLLLWLPANPLDFRDPKIHNDTSPYAYYYRAYYGKLSEFWFL